MVWFSSAQASYSSLTTEYEHTYTAPCTLVDRNLNVSSVTAGWVPISTIKSWNIYDSLGRNDYNHGFIIMFLMNTYCYIANNRHRGVQIYLIAIILAFSN